MTRKRTDKRAKQAVPEEILAEGSGPNEVVEADAQALADAAAEATERSSKRGRKGKVQVDAWGQPVEPSEGDSADEAEEPEAVETSSEEAPVVKKGKRGKKSKAREEDAAAEPTEALDEPIEADEAIEAAESDEVASDSDEPSEEAKSEQSLEDAVMRAEAEAELGAAAVEGEGGEGGESAEEGDVAGAALPTTAGSMDAAQLKNLVEALVFAADKPVTMQRLRQLTRVSEVKRLEQALTEIAADYQDRGIALQHVSGGYQFRTNTTYSVWVQQLIAGRPVRLSRAQLETLAIVAYRQPITRPEVDEIRGVDSSATLRLLLDRSLIRVLGKKEDVGRPVLYGTTKEFLDFFSLQDLRELPTLREYSELTAESRKVMSDRLGIDADGSAVDEDGNPVDDGTDVLPDAPVDSMDASPADPGAEDEAAIEAVSAVTDVIGIEEERIDTTLPDETNVEASSDEQVEASSDEQVEASSDEQVEASSDEPMTTDDDVLAAAHDAAHDNDEPQGMPRGASQEDVIGGLEADSSAEPHAGEASEASADDSESALEASAHALDADPSSESLDETDKSPAE